MIDPAPFAIAALVMFAIAGAIIYATRKKGPPDPVAEPPPWPAEPAASAGSLIVEAVTPPPWDPKPKPTPPVAPVEPVEAPSPAETPVAPETPPVEPVAAPEPIPVITEPVPMPETTAIPADPETVFRAWLEYTYPAQAKLTHTLRSPWADEQVRNGVKPATKLEPWARLAGLGEYGTHLSATPGNYTIISDWSAAVIQAQGPDSEWAWPGIALSRSYWPGYKALINALRHPDWPARINALMG